jgi:hypothetical protein
MTGMTSTLHEDLCKFMRVSRLILVRMRNNSDESYRGNQTHVLCSKPFFPKIVPSMRMWKNIVEPERTQMTI